MERIKILYLHIYEDEKTQMIRKILEELYGKENILSSRKKYRTLDILIFIVIYILCICCALICFYYLCIVSTYTYILIPPCIIITVIIFFIGSIIIYELLYSTFLYKANKSFDQLKPHVIVAYQFGCILATHLDGPKVPMLLISPVEENFFSNKIRKKINISDYPYIIFVHTTKDKKRYLKKSLSLIESLDKKKYRVEIVDEGYHLELLSPAEYKYWIDEIYSMRPEYPSINSQQ
ncbi:hypothetical protein PGSY75_0718900 [Plasmodium gaboni]|uniref:Uncharacterized protein n=1 Tax=Plasmodium gaboni TaxID=647221 RepID=A0A151LQC3_9APIC|nr:hypothetical protein PGSY75_0718900 [Plasmodium gaboni]KYO01327.1 hypothetical protein PGSY75_0718900 [Plasmodium gaboni]